MSTAVHSLPLDPEIARMCEDAASFPAEMMAARAAMFLASTGHTIGAYFEGLAFIRLNTVERPPVLFTGYRPEAARRNVAHRTFRDGLCAPAPRVPAAQARVNREFAILYAVAS